VSDLANARKILGKDAIIGVTASSEEEAIRAAEGGAEYLGIGTVYATLTYVVHSYRFLYRVAQWFSTARKTRSQLSALLE